jgi:tetratricopeptide (TPR) repeat protein
MLCKLSEFAISVVSQRILPATLLFLSLAWFADCPAARAQTPETDRADGSISGTVYAQDRDHPATQAAVSIKSHEVGVFRSVLTDYDGRFEVSGLPSGTYEIRIEEDGYEPLHTTTKLEGPSANVELCLRRSLSPQIPPNAYKISVRELSIPGKAHEEFNRGLDSLGKKDFTTSLKHFAKAIQKFPGYFEAFYHQGVVQMSLGQLEEAMQAFQKAIDLSGGRYARADFGIGYVLYLEGKAGEAEGVIRRGLELDGNSADGYLFLGLTQLRLNQPEEAEKSAREALLRNPNLANAYLVLADSFGRRENYREQVQYLNSYLRLQPNGPSSQSASRVRDAVLKVLAESQAQH